MRDERADEALRLRSPICKRRRITCFIDDRADVLRSMEGIVPVRLHFGVQTATVPGTIPVASWSEAERAAMENLSARTGAA